MAEVVDEASEWLDRAGEEVVDGADELAATVELVDGCEWLVCSAATSD